MPKIKLAPANLARAPGKLVNWYPGHMMAGLKAMIGKLNTVDCIIEVHDARIPFTGRNTEFAKHLGAIKPRLLVLNKSDLADLSRWDHVKKRLEAQNDLNVMLTDLTGNEFSSGPKGHTKLMQKVVDMVHNSDRHNRETMSEIKVMIVGIPNVGKSTLINRLRQTILGFKGQPAKVGSTAGVTRAVQERVKICSRPPIYSVDTPGVLQPGSTRNHHQAMQLALCSTINDKVLKPKDVAQYLLDHLNTIENYTYKRHYDAPRPMRKVEELVRAREAQLKREAIERGVDPLEQPIKTNADHESWRFIHLFRKGLFGLIMFD